MKKYWNRNLMFIALVLIGLSACNSTPTAEVEKTTDKAKEMAKAIVEDSQLDAKNPIYPQEKNFAGIKQLTFGGDNAEAYFSFNDKWGVNIFLTKLD